ncbi:MAG: hypothetical protein JW932_12010, partial [Deltaproteobacteria bacterium]|nr:hypothetical protein [Deltaproteobacteria bacterium]
SSLCPVYSSSSIPLLEYTTFKLNIHTISLGVYCFTPWRTTPNPESGPKITSLNMDGDTLS